MKILTFNSSLQMFSPENDCDLQLLIPKIIPAYKRVFGDEIWQEGLKCSKCNRQYAYPNLDSDPRTCCDQPLVDFYTNAEVQEMLEELTLNRYQLRVIMAADEAVIGFQWGWVDSLKNINTKLDLRPNVFRQLQARLEAEELYSPQMYYSSESGVLPAFRRQGLAKLMYMDLAKEVTELTRYKISRTSPRSPQYQFCQKRGDRVVLNYCENTLDRSVIDDRVLFAGLI